MRDTYSLYEAKAKLSAIIRRVREGHRVVVTLHGEPVAEIRPVESTSGGLQQRVAQFADRGILVRPTGTPAGPHQVVRRPGALKRFLADREG
ncbi:MAG: type II toxin-antitoxin system Phd/YefM family antitoxin [Gemmatimonadaceae bacterium]